MTQRDSHNKNLMLYQPAKVDDLAQLNRLLRQSKAQTTWYQNKSPHVLDNYMQQYRFVVDTLKHNFVIKGVLNGQIIAVFSFHLPQQKNPILNKFYLLPEYKGKGFGSQLWSATIEFVRNKSWDSFTIISTEDAEEFYISKGASKRGFTEIAPGRTLALLKYNLSIIS